MASDLSVAVYGAGVLGQNSRWYAKDGGWGLGCNQIVVAGSESRMRMAGLRWMVLVGLWAGLVTWHWLSAIPLVPTLSVAHGGHVGILPSDRGLILFHHELDASRRWSGTGPLEFWDAREGRITRQLLSRDDEMIWNQSYREAPDGYVLIRRDGQLVLIELESGQVLGTFEDVPKVDSYFVHKQRNQLVVNADRNVSCFRFDQTKPQWNMQDASVESMAAGDILSVARWKVSPSRKGARRIDSVLIHLETGGLDRRFEAMGKAWSSKLTSDGRLALVRRTTGPSNQEIYDVAAGKVLWQPAVATDESLRFSPDGREVVIWRSTNLGPVDVRRLRAEDGQAIVGEPPAELLASLPAGALKYLIRDVTDLSGTQIQKWRDALNQFWMKVGLHGMIVARGQEVRLVEAATGRDLGRLPSESRFTFTEQQRELVAVTPTHVQTYSLPPRRDYGWLAEWIVGPPLVLFLAGRWWRVVRRRRKGGAASEVATSVL